VFVDLGGGLGIPYKPGERAPSPSELADAVLPVFEERTKSMGIAPKLILEPGRYIMADSTTLLARVNTVKRAYKTASETGNV